MTVSQISISRFHHFHLARQLEKRGMLEAIFTGYPKFKLKDESGIPEKKIRSFPWVHTPFMARGKVGLTQASLSEEWAWWAVETLDWYASRRLGKSQVLVALSGSGLCAGKAMQRQGGTYICDRASSHIRFQDEILREEYARWGLEFRGVDARFIRKEEAEYAQADCITIPSEFVYRSFLEKGVPAAKLKKISYGARLDRFSPAGQPSADEFHVLFVGQITTRKGFLYLLEAFRKFRHPRKRLTVIGVMIADVKGLLPKYDLTDVEFLGTVGNADLPAYYSRANVLVLPSIEEGLSYVQGEALACGCPVVATPNTGAEDLFEDGQEGFIVPIRDSDAILEKLEFFAQDPTARDRMGEAGMQRVKSIGGWDTYGEKMVELLTSFSGDLRVR